MGVRSRTVLFSVHADDICMSVTGLLRAGWFGARPVLATVYSLSQHVVDRIDRTVWAEHGPAIRRREDRRFCDAFGLDYRTLDLRDVPLAPGDLAARSEYRRGLREQVAALIVELGGSVVVCPLPHGRNVHPHHRAVHEAVVEAVGELHAVSLWLVDDLPYSRLPIDRPVICAGQEYRPTVVPLSETDLKIKMAAMAIYASQMRPAYFRAVRRPAPGDTTGRISETIWLPLNAARPKWLRAGALGSACPPTVGGRRSQLLTRVATSR